MGFIKMFKTKTKRVMESRQSKSTLLGSIRIFFPSAPLSDGKAPGAEAFF
jgi:hypothetical protein